jgi:hypothetical protein
MRVCDTFRETLEALERRRAANRWQGAANEGRLVSERER